MEVNIPVLKQIMSLPNNTQASAPGKNGEEGCFERTLLGMMGAVSSEDSESDISDNNGNIVDKADEELMGPMGPMQDPRFSAVPEEELSLDLIWQWLGPAGAVGISEGTQENIPTEESDGEMAESLADDAMEDAEASSGEGVPLEEAMIFGAEQAVAFEAEGSVGGVSGKGAVAGELEKAGFEGIEPGNDPASSGREEKAAPLDEQSIFTDKNTDGKAERSATEADSTFRESLKVAGDKILNDSVQRSVSAKPEQNLQLEFLKFPADLSENKVISPTMAEISQQSFERMRAQVVDQVFGRLAYFRENQTVPAEMRLTLNPPSLGEVVIRVFSNHGKMTAEIITEMSRVKDMLENGMGEIKQRLQQVNLILEKIDVFCSEHDLKRDLSYRQSMQQGRSVTERAGSRIGIVEEAAPETWSVPVEGVSLELWA